MNILYIDHYAGSLKMGMEFRPFYLGREWQKNGHKVRVIAATFSHLRSCNPAIENDFEIEDVDGIQYQWVKTNEYSGNGISRARTMFSFVSKIRRHASKIVKDFHPDVVISSSTYPLDSYAAKKIAKKAKCKYVHEAHDIWPLTLIEIGRMSKLNPFVILLGIAEKNAYKKSDAVVSVLPYSYEHMLSKGLNNKNKFTHIPNGICLEDWDDILGLPKEHKMLFDKLHNENKLIIEYVGGHALSNYLDLLIDAAIKTKDDDSIAYVLIGKGVEKPKLMERCKQEQLTNVHFLPAIDKRSIPAALSMGNVLYVSAAKSPLYKFGISMNKLYDYMMAAKPILYGIDAPNNDVLDAKCGLYFSSDSVDSLIEKIYIFKNMPKKELESMGQSGKKWVLENCEYSVLAKKFLDVIERIKK